MKVKVGANSREARQSLEQNEVDLVLIEAGDGFTRAHVLACNSHQAQTILEHLPNFRLAGLTGIPGPPIVEFEFRQRADEVMRSFVAEALVAMG